MAEHIIKTEIMSLFESRFSSLKDFETIISSLPEEERTHRNVTLLLARQLKPNVLSSVTLATDLYGYYSGQRHRVQYHALQLVKDGRLQRGKYSHSLDSFGKTNFHLLSREWRYFLPALPQYVLDVSSKLEELRLNEDKDNAAHRAEGALVQQNLIERLRALGVDANAQFEYVAPCGAWVGFPDARKPQETIASLTLASLERLLRAAERRR